jgi:hypothetical protein
MQEHHTTDKMPRKTELSYAPPPYIIVYDVRAEGGVRYQPEPKNYSRPYFDDPIHPYPRIMLDMNRTIRLLQFRERSIDLAWRINDWAEKYASSAMRARVSVLIETVEMPLMTDYTARFRALLPAKLKPEMYGPWAVHILNATERFSAFEISFPSTFAFPASNVALSEQSKLHFVDIHREWCELTSHQRLWLMCSRSDDMPAIPEVDAWVYTAKADWEVALNMIKFGCAHRFVFRSHCARAQ